MKFTENEPKVQSLGLSPIKNSALNSLFIGPPKPIKSREVPIYKMESSTVCGH
jgi:hypothetical protein